MRETKTAEERKQERETNVLDRRNESQDSINGVHAPLQAIDSDTLAAIDDPDVREQMRALAVGYAHLAELITGRDPPATEPYGLWHQNIEISGATIEQTTDVSVTASVSVDTVAFYDDDPTVILRVNERDNIDAEPITATTTATEGETPTLTVNGLKSDTEYSVRLSAEVNGDSDYAETLTATTDASES
jgi:hypothetical protein